MGLTPVRLRNISHFRHPNHAWHREVNLVASARKSWRMFMPWPTRSPAGRAFLRCDFTRCVVRRRKWCVTGLHVREARNREALREDAHDPYRRSGDNRRRWNGRDHAGRDHGLAVGVAPTAVGRRHPRMGRCGTRHRQDIDARSRSSRITGSEPWLSSSPRRGGP